MSRPRVILQRVDFDSLGVKNSVVVDNSDDSIELDGDQLTPGNSKVYGTNEAGEKGWQSRPSGFLRDDGAVIRFKTFPIGAWNMDTTASVTVPFDRNYSTIRGISVVVETNIAGIPYPLDWFNGTAVQGGWEGSLQTQVILNRLSGGVFDDPAFSGTENRGYVTITYTE